MNLGNIGNLTVGGNVNIGENAGATVKGGSILAAAGDIINSGNISDILKVGLPEPEELATAIRNADVPDMNTVDALKEWLTQISHSDNLSTTVREKLTELVASMADETPETAKESIWTKIRSFLGNPENLIKVFPLIAYAPKVVEALKTFLTPK